MSRRLALLAASGLALVAGLAYVAVPPILRSRMQANETRAIALANRLALAEEQFQQIGIRDGDGDGIGEYGYFPQLAEAGMLDRWLAEEARDLEGDVVVDGYRFRLFLPLDGGSPRRGTHPLPIFEPADADDQETSWVCYAWPEVRELTGWRAFVVNQEASIYQSANSIRPWSGADGPTRGDEAFLSEDDMTGPLSSGAPTAEGKTWTTV